MAMNEQDGQVGFHTRTETEKITRFRRLAMRDTLRSMVRETELSTNDFIYV